MCDKGPSENQTVSVREVIRYLETERFLDKREAAEFLRISVRNLTTRIREIPHFRLGKKILFKLCELKRYMEAKRERTSNIDRMIDEVLKDLRSAKVRYQKPNNPLLYREKHRKKKTRCKYEQKLQIRSGSKS